jgi:hypothetical protein
MTNLIIASDVQIKDKNHKLISLGFFYKNDARDGFGAMLSDSSVCNQEIKNRDSSFNLQLSKIKNGTCPDFKTTDEWIKGLTDQLPAFIKAYYQELGFSNGLQPLTHYDVDFSNRTVCMLHELIIDNIYILTKLDVIKNDEYNGVLYHYEKKMSDREMYSMLDKMGV